MTLDSLFGRSESLSNFEAMPPDTHNLVGLSDTLRCNSVKCSEKPGGGDGGFPHTITDWVSLVTLDSSIPTSEATAPCATVFNVIRARCRPPSISLGSRWLIVNDWLRTTTVICSITRRCRSIVLASADRAGGCARRCRNRAQKRAVVVAHDHFVWINLQIATCY